MAKKSKYQSIYDRAKQNENKTEDLSKSIHADKFGYNQNSPASITKTRLDNKANNIKKNLMLFIIALLALIIVGLGIESAIKHENPITVVKESMQANPPAKWKPNSDVANQKYNFDGSSSSSSSSNTSGVTAGISSATQDATKQTNDNNFDTSH